MVYLSGKNTNLIQEALNKSNIEFSCIDWKGLKKIKNGILILTELPGNNDYFNYIKSFAEHSIPVIALINKAGDPLLCNSILFLPHDISVSILIAIVTWLLSKKDNSIYLDAFNSFLKGADFHIFFIDSKNKILNTFPEKGSFLGYSAGELLNNDFEEIFELPIDSVHRNKQNKNGIYPVYRSNGIKTAVKIVKLSADKTEIYGAPENTQIILILTEVNKSKSLKEKAERMAVIQSNISKYRTIELEAANEKLQKQAVELKNAMEQLDKRNNQIIKELSLASDLQKSLIPKNFPADLPLNFSQKYLPYAYIGGDFFEIIRLDKDKIGIIITDVSGHGVSSAFITAMFKTAFYHFAKDDCSPASTLSKLNKEFCATLHTEHYLTAFYAVFDTMEMKCIYCNAGHPGQLLICESGDIIELTTMGFFIGMFEGTEYEEKVIDLNPGDRIIYFTDGIIEIENDSGEQFGKDNLKKIFLENREMDISNISNLVIQELMMYMASETFQDDITLLIIEIMESI